MSRRGFTKKVGSEYELESLAFRSWDVSEIIQIEMLD